MGMAWTIKQRDELQAAIASGLRSVRYEGPPAREETYQDLGQMRALLAEMNRQLNGSQSPNFRLAVVKSGLVTGGGAGTDGNQ